MRLTAEDFQLILGFLRRCKDIVSDGGCHPAAGFHEDSVGFLLQALQNRLQSDE